MDITAIQTFLTVQRLGALNRAAAELNVTQSTVTARLDTLDAAFGAPLITRSRKGATLTKTGWSFLAEAEMIAAAWIRAQQRINLPKGSSGLLSFGCDPSLWSSFGEEWVSMQRHASPGLSLEAWPGGLTDLSRWLSSALIDVAISIEPIHADGLISNTYAQNRIHQVATIPRKAQDWHRDYIFVDHGPAFRRWHGEIWHTTETAPLSFGSNDWALTHILKHGGSAYLPRRITTPLIGDLLFEVQGAPEFDCEINLTIRDQSASMIKEP
jgi:DNA-binding transcriptional LysR family regulator